MPVALALLAALLVPLLGLAVGSAGLLTFASGLPDVAALEQLPSQFQPSTAASHLYAWDAPVAGETGRPVVIDTIIDPRATGTGWLPAGQLPDHVIDAFLAGIDPAFLSAAPASWTEELRDWWQTGIVPGPSSPLTAELMQNHLGRGMTANSDLGLWQDWFLTRQIDGRYSREQQLEWAINTTYFGNLAYGIDAAAWVYFGKGAGELTPAEASMLSAAAQNPATNPFDDPSVAEQNRAAILSVMTAAGTITIDDAAAALTAPLLLAAPPGSEAMAPAFARLARRELEAILGPERLLAGGWQVETTLDLALQAQAECVLAAQARSSTGTAGGPPCPALDYMLPDSENAASLDARGPDGGSIVAIHPATGAIRALAGDSDSYTARPIGVLAQPFIYLTALSQGYSAASLTMDVPSIYLQDGRPYSPRNADGAYLGPLRLREAMADARIVPATEVLSWVGVDRVLATARALGLESSGAVAADLTLPAAGFPATLLDIGRAFAAIANGGTMAGVALSEALPQPATVQRVTAADGSDFYAYEPANRETLSPELAYLVNDILSDPEARCRSGDCPAWPVLPGEWRAAFAGGETDAGDSWAVGHTPALLIGVWSGAASAADIWRGLMSWNVAESPAVEWSPVDGLRAVEVCAVSGLLPSRQADCPTVREWFVPGTEPSEVDDMVREIAVNRETGRLATIFTPPHLIERRTYIDYPPAAAAWAADAGIESPPTEYDTIRRIPTRDGGAAILSPEPWSVIGRQESPWSVVGSAGGEDFAYYRLAYFPGLLPEAMQSLVARGETPVDSAELGAWDTTLVEDGLYTLLLTIVRQDGTFDEVAVPVTVGAD